jgi:hypothetical protein
MTCPVQKYRLYLKRVSGVAPAGPSGRGSGSKGMRLPGMPGVGHGAAVTANAAPGAMPDVMAAAGQSPAAPGADASGAGAAAAGQGAPLAGFASPPMGMQQVQVTEPFPACAQFPACTQCDRIGPRIGSFVMTA